jgi:hypothetical protein
MTDRRAFWNGILRDHAAIFDVSLPKLGPIDIAIRRD